MFGDAINGTGRAHHAACGNGLNSRALERDLLFLWQVNQLIKQLQLNG